jgi:predicted MFS family arabinose efflux permease
MSIHIDTVTAVDATAPTPVLSPGTGRVIVLLAMIAFGSAMSLRVMDAAIPRLATDFDISIRQAANVVTCFAVAYGCLQVVFGPSGDRYGKLKVILCACVSGALASIACAFAPNFTTLLLARLWAGASMASMMPLAIAWIGDNVSYENRQPVLAKFLVGQITGIAVGQAAGGIASDLLTWRAPFVALAFWFVLMAVLLFRVTRQPRFRIENGNASKLSLIAQCRSVLIRPWARRVLLTVFIEGGALYGPFAFFATHLHLKHGLSLAFSGTMLVAFAIGGISYSFGAGRLIGRLGEAGLARGGALLMFVGISAVALGPPSMPASLFALPGMFAMGLGFYMLHNTLQINATQMAPETRGTATALFSSAFFLGQSTGVVLVGYAVERVTTTPVLLTGAIVLLIVGITFGRLRERRDG